MTNEYICNDNPVEESERIKRMSEEELEKEFLKLFGDYIDG